MLITGRNNYRKFSELTGIDLIKNPNIASDPYIGLLITVLFWHNRGLNDLADQGDIASVSRRLTGGTAGLAERKNWIEKIQRVLSVTAH